MTTQQLIDENLDLVKYRSMAAARRFGDEYGEYMTSAYVGLAEAAKRFDPKRNNSFRTFAQSRVDGAILDQVRKWHGRKGGRRWNVQRSMKSLYFHQYGTYNGAADRHMDDVRSDVIVTKPLNEVDEWDEIEAWKRRVCPHNEQVNGIIDALAEGKTIKQAGKSIGKSEARAWLYINKVIRPIMRDHLSRKE